MDSSKRDHQLRAIARKQRRELSIPADATCIRCGSGESLSRGHDGTIHCYACQLLEAGKVPIERDHIAGRANSSATIDLRANEHRWMSEFRTANGIDDWPKADGNPAVATGHFLAGIAGIILLIGRWLKDLGVWLDQPLGPGWSRSAPPSPVLPS